MLSQIAITHHAFSLQPDVALCLSSFEGDAVPLSPFLPAQHMPVPTAAIFYDIIPHRLPRLYQQHNGQRMAYKRRLEALGRFDLLLAISDYAGREAMAMGEPADTVNISAGLSPDFVSRIGRPVSRHVKSFVSADRKSLLYVGGLDQRKNLARLVAAIGKLPASVVAKLELIIVGEPQPVELAELRSNWAAAALPGESLRLFGFASDDDLVGLYKSVDLCVQPSLLEGFGLTVLEAMSCGVPVIASDRGALPEVVGVGKFLFDPENVSDIADKIAWVLSNPPEMESLLASARKRVDAFTWDNTAERTVEALKSLVTRKQLPTPSIDELRALAVEAVRKIPYAAKQASELLAAAEPMPEQAPRLLVDITSTARIDHKTGIQRVVKKISQYLMDHTPEDMEVVLMGADTGLGFFRTSINDKTGTWDAHRDDTIRISPNDTILMLDSSWEFHAQHLENLRLARLSGARIISVLYDLVPVYSPAFCGDGMPEIFSEWLKSALAYSTGFLCISKAVADELLSLLEAIKFPRSMDVGYFHLGADFAAPGGIAPPKAVPTDRPCYLMVGTMEPRKGHRVVLDAFDELWREGIDVSLTLVGRRGWGADALIDRIIQHAEFGKRLEWRSNVHDEELAEVYARSDALIAASYAEGFGLPVIEAARYGKPILASDLPVFKEVAGEKAAIRYFETGNSNALGSLIRSKPRPDPVATSGNDVGITWDESGQQV
ncbi:MAG: glycosyltransferase family 1 protein, partial [Pseudomonadota bacterium]